jgi:hypothetical protein
MLRKLIVFPCLMLAVIISAFAEQPKPVSVMTQNMDAGSDLTFVIGELLGDLPTGVGSR